MLLHRGLNLQPFHWESHTLTTTPSCHVLCYARACYRIYVKSVYDNVLLFVC